MYHYDQQAAIAGSTGSVSNRIDREGAYTGTINYLRQHKSNSSPSKGVRISFTSDDGRDCNLLDIWTHGKEGNVLHGFNSVQALMAVANKGGISFVDGRVMEYEFSAGKDVNIVAAIDPNYQGLKIGLVLNLEHYTNGTGVDRTRMVYVTCFDPQNQRVASEIIQDQPAEELERIIQHLKPKDQRKQKPVNNAPSNTGNAGGGYSQTAPPISAYDDDVPF